MNARITTLAVVMALFQGSAASAPDGIDPGDLPDFFAGSWTIEGREDTFRETCEWLSPNSFLVCRGADTDPESPSKWITLLGYSHAEKTYNFTAFDDGGGKSVLSGWLRGGVWVFTTEQVIDNETSRLQVTITPTSDGYVLREEQSVNGGPWKASLEEKHVRLSAPGS